MSDRRTAKAIDVVRRRPLEPAGWDHAIAVADPAVAGNAVDVELRLALFDELLVQFHWQVGYELAPFLAGEQRGVGFELAAGNGAGDQRTRDAAILEELARFERLLLGLVVHVLMAAGGKGQRQQQDQH